MHNKKQIRDTGVLERSKAEVRNNWFQLPLERVLDEEDDNIPYACLGKKKILTGRWLGLSETEVERKALNGLEKKISCIFFLKFP